MTDETLFAVALEKADPVERRTYLDSACGDPDQRKRVEGLLEALEKAGGFLDKPAVAMSDAVPTHTYSTPDDGSTRTHGEGAESDTDDALGFLSPPQRPDSLGRIGHYEVLEVLGRGGFGIVFRAFDEMLQRVVAVKVLSPSMAATSPARKRFTREARSAALIRHENVVTIHEVGETPLPYLVMEFVPGETLQERLDRIGPLEVAEALRIGREIAEGLAAAHEQGLIHRDIKPSNILIERGPQERAKITDFGLARAADDASLTRSGVVAGTPMYMAPEQAKSESLDHRADLFSLGSVMYAMLTGRPPFRAENTPAVLKRVADDDPRPIREVIPEVPEWFCRIVEKLHAKNPSERYQTAREVADVLADCQKQLAAHKELKDFARIPEAKPAPAPMDNLAMLVFVGGTGIFALIGAILIIVDVNKLLSKSELTWLVYGISGIVGLVGMVWALRLKRRIPPYARLAADPSTHPEPKPTRSRFRRVAAVVGVLALISVLLAVVMVKSTIYRFAGNRGEIEFTGSADPDVEKLLVRRNGELVATLDRTNPRTSLAPGEYEVEAVCIDGYEATKFHVDTTRFFTASGAFERVEGRPVIKLTVRRGDSTTIAVIAERRAAPPSSPAVPRTAADVLPFLAGNWKVERQDVVSPPIPPDEVLPSAAAVTYDWVARGKFLRGRSSIFSFIYSYDSEKDVLRMWGVWANGDAGGPGLGVFNPDNRSLLWRYKFGDGAELVHQYDFVDANTIRSRVFVQDSSDKIVLDIRLKFTRIKGPVTIPKLPIDPKRPDEMKVLDRLIGDWRIDETVTSAASPGKPEVNQSHQKAQPILAGRMIETFETNETKKTSDYSLIWYDVTAKRYRLWAFQGNGQVIDLSGTWNEATKTIAFTSPDGATFGHSIFKSDDRYEYLRAVKNRTGKTVFEATGVARRTAPVWVSLFNGKDLTGWKVNPRYPAKWSVESGILVSHGGTGMLFSERDNYRDFHLRAEVNINAAGDSGIFFRSDYAKHPERSYEAMPGHTQPNIKDAGLVRWVLETKVLEPIRWPAATAYPVDQWFTIEIIARGSHLVVKIDGKTAVDAVDPDPILAPGHIALQQWNRLTTVQFRKIEIKELPPTTAKKEPNPAVLKPLRDAVEAKERVRDTVKTRFDVGTANKIELLAAEADLTEARIKFAEAEGDQPAGIVRLAELVKFRQEERDLIKLRVDLGKDAPVVLNQADFRLAQAKARLAKLKPSTPLEVAPPPRPKPEK
ncbi:MAG: protein kinase [Planctomycetia bacterium]|nr:protein kinase [Planctomycetia bacterium]